MKRDHTASRRMRNDLFHFLLSVMILPVWSLPQNRQPRRGINMSTRILFIFFPSLEGSFCVAIGSIFSRRFCAFEIPFFIFSISICDYSFSVVETTAKWCTIHFFFPFSSRSFLQVLFLRIGPIDV